MAAENDRKTRLQKLSGSDYEIVDGQPDIRDWDVKDSTGNKLGEVDELIFDYESRKVRYLVVDIEGVDDDTEAKEVLVPIGIAELHESDDDVILPGVTMAQLRSLPEYNEGRFDTEHETSVRNVFGGLGGAALAGGAEDDFYNHQHFNEGNLYRNRRIETDEKSNTGSTKQTSTNNDDNDEEDWVDDDDANRSTALHQDVLEYDALGVGGPLSPAAEDTSLTNDIGARDEAILNGEDDDNDDALRGRSDSRNL